MNTDCTFDNFTQQLRELLPNVALRFWAKDKNGQDRPMSEFELTRFVLESSDIAWGVEACGVDWATNIIWTDVESMQDHGLDSATQDIAQTIKNLLAERQRAN